MELPPFDWGPGLVRAWQAPRQYMPRGGSAAAPCTAQVPAPLRLPLVLLLSIWFRFDYSLREVCPLPAPCGQRIVRSPRRHNGRAAAQCDHKAGS